MVWAELKERVSAMGVVDSIEELKKNVEKAWDEIPMERINAYVGHFENALRKALRQ
jgi:hypothetical protein